MRTLGRWLAVSGSVSRVPDGYRELAWAVQQSARCDSHTAALFGACGADPVGLRHMNLTSTL